MNHRFLPLRPHWFAAVAAMMLIDTASANTTPSTLGMPAGTADFAIGNVIAHGADGIVRTIAKGDVIRSGDRISTQGGRLQIRFTDGAYVSLLPQTEFRVHDYRYDGQADGTETGFYSIVRGTIRIVTGAIGRVNRARFQINTPTATIGVRGTGGIIEVEEDGATRLTGTSGIWTLANFAGMLTVPAGSIAVTSVDRTAPPRLTTRSATSAVIAAGSTANMNASEAQPAQSDEGAPTSTTPQMTVLGNGAGSSSNATGDSAPNSARQASPGPVVALIAPGTVDLTTTVPGGSTSVTSVTSAPTPTPTPSTGAVGAGSGGFVSIATSLSAGTMAATYAYGFEERTGNTLRINRAADTTAATSVDFAPAGQVVRIGGMSVPSAGIAGNAREVGNDGVVGWGRWLRDVSGIGSTGVIDSGQGQGLHYVVGAPTIDMPTANPGARAFTNFVLSAGGATAPTIAGTSLPAGSLTAAAMSVDFVSRRIGVDLTTTFSGFGVRMTTTGGTANPLASGVTYSAGSAVFRGDFGSVTVSGAPPANFCPTGCTGGVQGFFAGSQAARAAMTYQASTPGTAGAPAVQGAAVFTRAQ